MATAEPEALLICRRSQTKVIVRRVVDSKVDINETHVNRDTENP